MLSDCLRVGPQYGCFREMIRRHGGTYAFAAQQRTEPPGRTSSHVGNEPAMTCMAEDLSLATISRSCLVAELAPGRCLTSYWHGGGIDFHPSRTAVRRYSVVTRLFDLHLA